MKAISKKQLALAVAKGKRVALLEVLKEFETYYQAVAISAKVSKATPQTAMHDIINRHIEVLDEFIIVLDGTKIEIKGGNNG